MFVNKFVKYFESFKEIIKIDIIHQCIISLLLNKSSKKIYITEQYDRKQQSGENIN